MSSRNLESSLLALPHTPVGLTGVYWRPSGIFVEELAQWLRGKRVLEVFSGNGYLAAWLARYGVPVLATTRFSGHDAHEVGLYHPVLELDACSAVREHGASHDVLLVCWPTVTDEVLRACLLWGQDKPIVFIGEVSDPAQHRFGGCASDAFFQHIERTHTFGTYRGNMLEAAFACRMRPR